MYQFFLKVSKFMAYLGGVVLSALIIMTFLSVVGRALNGFMHSDIIGASFPAFGAWALSLGLGPINGDFELIEAGVAFSIFAFIPLCQITGGHASVDIFTSIMGDRTNRFLRMLIEVIFALVLVLIAVQLFSGLLSKMRSGQTTYLIQFPIWWAYAASMTGAVVAATVSVYLALVRIQETFTGRTILPTDLGADH